MAPTERDEPSDHPSLEGLEELVPPPDPLIGTLVGERYRVTDLIGRGGMGAVYRAEHVHMRKSVALKVLHREMTALDEVVARFEREAIAAGRIEHPNVVQARDFGRLPDGAFYLVLEYVEGRVLDRVLRDEGETFSVERVLNITGQIAEALQAAHEKKIVHRDLKPDNVILVERGDEPEVVKVLDFGIAKISVHERHTDQPITQAGTVFGTPEYMSPEQAAGQAVDHRGDLYSLGLLMYRMLAGNPPFTSTDVQAVLMMQITQPPPEIDRALPTEVHELLFELLEKDPDARIQSASEVVQRVLDILGAELTPLQSRTRARLASISAPDLVRPTWVNRLDAGPLGRLIPVAGQRVPLWRLGSVAGIALMVGVAVVLATVWSKPRAHQQPAPPAVAARSAEVPVSLDSAPLPDVDPKEDKLLGRAFVGDKQAVAELELKAPAERSARDWLALGRGYAKNRRLSDAIAAYKAALELQPTVGEDAVLRRDLWSAANDGETAELALNLAADYLGSQGGDLLYKIWVDTKDVTPATQLARTLLYRKDVRDAATPALQFLLSWREAIGCDDYSRLLPQAALHADRRAITLLKRAQLRNECELPKEVLDAAILAAKDRSEPAPY